LALGGDVGVVLDVLTLEIGADVLSSFSPGFSFFSEADLTPATFVGDFVVSELVLVATLVVDDPFEERFRGGDGVDSVLVLVGLTSSADSSFFSDAAFLDSGSFGRLLKSPVFFPDFSSPSFVLRNIQNFTTDQQTGNPRRRSSTTVLRVRMSREASKISYKAAQRDTNRRSKPSY